VIPRVWTETILARAHRWREVHGRDALLHAVSHLRAVADDAPWELPASLIVGSADPTTRETFATPEVHVTRDSYTKGAIAFFLVEVQETIAPMGATFADLDTID
jgi:hypothetical protein